MRKFYSIFAFAAMMLVSLTASAWSFDLTDENTVLENEEAYNMRLFKSYDFFNGNYNGNPFTDESGNTVSGDGCFTLSADASGMKLGFDAYQVLAPSQMNNFYIGIGTGAINLRAGVSKDGLHNYGSGSRFFMISDVKAGQIIVCQWGVTTTRASVVQPNPAKLTNATACTYEDISAAVHAAQGSSIKEGDEVATPDSDSYSYWRATSDGYFVVEMQRDCAVQGIQIWIDKSAAEAVSTPSLKVVAVDGNSRKIDFKAGESTFGNETKTYYSLDGSDPIFLKDSDVPATWSYTYDDNGAKLDSVPETYKKVLDTDKVTETGYYGDFEYNPEDGSIDVSSNDDEDGDGYVTIKAAAVSLASGIVSDIVSVTVSVGEIELNAPTLTLCGIDGDKRTYSIGWTNNTLCGEDYQLVVEGDDASQYFELEANTGLGTSYTVSKNLKVTVKVNGYNDGVAELSELAYSGVNIHRKAAVTTKTVDITDANGVVTGTSTIPVHDWDFVNISDDQYAMFTQDQSNANALAGCYVKTETDSLVFSVDEFIAGVSSTGVDLSSATPIFKESGWYSTISNSRTTLNVVSDTIYTGEIYDKNANGYGYVKENTGIFDGLTISCPPNTSNNSTILKYIDKADWADTGYNGDGITKLGVYFLSKPTFTFPRESAAAGELVAIYTGTGGSNYTTTRTLSFYEVPTGELLSATLAAGTHVFYIDVYTYDGLPTDEYDPTAIKSVAPQAGVQKIVGYYTLNGAKVAQPQRGVNIVKYADGTSMKVMVK